MSLKLPMTSHKRSCMRHGNETRRLMLLSCLIIAANSVDVPHPVRPGSSVIKLSSPWPHTGRHVSMIEVLSIRGGSSKTANIKQRKKSKKKKKKQATATPQESTSLLHNEETHEPLPTIKAILVPRLISITMLIKWICLATLSVSVVFCKRTAGIPHARAVAKLVNQCDATNLKPIHEVLARRIASSKNEVIPPRHLPLPVPLLGVLFSLGTWVCCSVLFPRWFVSVNVFLNYKQKSLGGATAKDLLNKIVSASVHLLVLVPRELRDSETEGKSSIIRPLHISESEPTKSQSTLHGHPLPFYFELNQQRFYCDPFHHQDSPVINGSPVLHTDTPLSQLVSPSVSSGLSSRSRLKAATERFGPYKRLALPTPTVKLAFIERISTPLVSLQILGRILNALEESLFGSIANLAQTLANHYWHAKESIVSANELAKEVKGNVEDGAAMKVWAVRPTEKGRKKKKRWGSDWVEIPASGLLPGDVFVLGNVERGLVMPVDALLLEGNCVANEAVLTGETVPQSKTPLDNDEASSSTDRLDIMSKHRNSVLFAGTSLIHCTHHSERQHDDNGLHPPFPSILQTEGASPAKLLALRTGSYSSRGEMMRALAKSRGHAGSISNPQTERDAVRLIAALSVFAAIACVSLFVPMPFPNSDFAKPRKASTFRRVVQCTRIMVSSIPSDISLCLSTIAQSCSRKVRTDADVACSEPGSLLTSAQVDVVVFDKTGTLTADTQSLSRIISPPHQFKATQMHPMTDAVLAGCHSLVNVESDDRDGQTVKEQLVGDPLDLASFKFSGWSYDSTHDCYVASEQSSRSESSVSPPQMLWQIKTFPFDPRRRTSSAVILVLHQDKGYRLWQVVKGSPDVLSSAVASYGAEALSFSDWYLKENRILEGQGMRNIVLAAKDITDVPAYTEMLFTAGLPEPATSSVVNGDQNMSYENVLKAVEKARDFARHLHRDEIEGFDTGNNPDGKLEFVGFAAFGASVRPSTKRIIGELRNAGVKVLMLTGDSVDAAISVGRKAGLIECPSISLVDVEGSRLVLEELKMPSNKKLKLGLGPLTEYRGKLTRKRLDRIIRQVQSKGASIVLTGKAFDTLNREQQKDPISPILLQNLSAVSIIARASPKTKRQVVSCLKNRSSNAVLMCGDGVNDVAAMKSADVSVALLNGYGDETVLTDIDLDIEDERRREKLVNLRIGRNRMKRSKGTSGANAIEDAGIGDTPGASMARVRAHIAEALQTNEGSSIKQTLAAVRVAIRNERKRKSAIKKGGAAAARVFADDDKLRKALLKKSRKGLTASGCVSDKMTDTSIIKPGEASLAAAFSCLRPAIDGVDAILREGIAAAACCIKVQQTIALNCLMSSYNLATLYRDGFRYGNKMWPIEILFFALVDSASYSASCQPRPRISSSRPCPSLFHPSSALAVCAQAAIHLITLNAGVKWARVLDSQDSVAQKKKARVRWRGPENSGMAPTSPIAMLLQSLSAPSTAEEEEEETNHSVLNIFGRPPFRPNYTTNVVFLLSVFQNAVTYIVNHKGKPFCLGASESRNFCLFTGGSILFVISCISEAFPALNQGLELRLTPTKSCRLRLVLLLLTDFAGCYAADRICSLSFNRPTIDSRSSRSKPSNSSADYEESLLLEESKENRLLLLMMALAGATLMLDLLT